MSGFDLDLSRSRLDRDEGLRTNLEMVARGFDVDGFASMRQLHGADVRVVDRTGLVPGGCDGLVTATPELALMVRVGDCAPVVLADIEAGIVGVAHAGRQGLVAGVLPATVATMRSLGASSIEAWVGPHVCGGCYEVPASLRDQVAASVSASYACTTWGTPSVDIGAGVNAQLKETGCIVHDRSRCTVEASDLYSYRRDGEHSGRFAGLVVWRPDNDG
ncbi:MAG: polyphenol oxidase family protein [Actinomycetota bacterium]|nr:polyphenol oxidase family protein [Actinomycetota bacterium]